MFGCLLIRPCYKFYLTVATRSITGHLTEVEDFIANAC